LTERSLSARGRGSRVVVTVMLWAIGEGFVGGAEVGACCCGGWARAALSERRLRRRWAEWIFMVIAAGPDIYDARISGKRESSFVLL
jgi:hypothetical protein